MDIFKSGSAIVMSLAIAFLIEDIWSWIDRFKIRKKKKISKEVKPYFFKIDSGFRLLPLVGQSKI